MTTNSTISNGSDTSLLPFEAKQWIENTFHRSLFNVVWENDEPVSLIVTVNYYSTFYMSKGTTLVEIQQELQEWQSKGYPEPESKGE